MLNLIQRIKAFNRKRVQDRRNSKFQSSLSNDFDREILSIDQLKILTQGQKGQKVHPSSRIAVYSTYMGASNTKTFRRSQVDRSIDHYFISNNQDVLSAAKDMGWMGIELNLPVSSNRILSAQQSKIAKAMPHLFGQLGNYDYLLYVDDKIEFSTNHLAGWISEIERNQAMLMIRRHPDLKKNILNEFGTSMIQARYQAQKDQMAEYISAKVDEGYQLRVDKLYWTSALLRNMRHPKIIDFNESWYKDIVSCGIECQISFDFVAQNFSEIIEMPQIIN